MNIDKIRKDFPTIDGKRVYLDSACQSLRPVQVINAINSYYKEFPGCGGRSIHKFGNKVSEEVDRARESVRKFINAKERKEIIFNRNTTEGINLIANSFNFQKGDKVVISDKEHNSNLLPWLFLKRRKGINLEIVKTHNGVLDMNEFSSKVKNAKFVSILHSSNIDGVTNDMKEITKISHENNALILVDGAQSVPHKEIDVKKLDVDFFAFSGHKMLGPSGIGALYGKKELLEKLDSFLIGGDTVKDTTYDSYILEEIPERFEAGLQDYAGIIGFGEAARYLMDIRKDIERHEINLNKILTEKLKGKVKILGPEDASLRGGIFSFNLPNMEPNHVAMILDEQNVMIRSGYHCVHSWFNARNIKGSARVSFYLYNNEEEIDKFVNASKPLLK